MQEVLRTYKHEDKVLKIMADELAESPREWANLGTMVCWHRRYRLGDDHAYPTPADFWLCMAAAIVGNKALGLRRAQRIVQERAVVLPLHIYDHSGLIMSTSRGYPFNDPWDAGQVGWIYVTLAKVRQEFGVRRITAKVREKAIEALKDEVEVYSRYLSGDVYAFIIEDVEGNSIDSCGGFYGPDPRENGMAEHAGDEWFNETVVF